MADIQACREPEGNIVNEERGRHYGERQRGQFGSERWRQAGSRFGWDDWEMMGILPGLAKLSVMFSLITGDCQQGGATGRQRLKLNG